ncbi:MAG: response regulator [Candidatus Nealsonbacteria bacterium]|nr:response regulator [Candidatus Nealsonbacteria bacterium]
MALSQIDKGPARLQQAVSPDGRGVVQNQPERGAGTLPAQEASARQARAVTDRRRVLLAEDDDEMRALLAWRLRKDGYEVTECDHGIDLINRIDPLGGPGESEEFDLVVSDIRMPGITGLEVLEDMRHCGTECPPVILITAFGDEETHQQARRLGAVAMFDKPFDFNDLLATVREIVSPRSLSGEGIALERSPVEPVIRASVHRPTSKRFSEQERK